MTAPNHENHPQGWHLAVVIPARDEEDLVAGAVASVIDAIEVAAAAALLASSRVVVVADRCSDATVRLARAALRPTDEVVTVRLGSVGAARAAGVERAVHHLPDPQRSWVANTDADSVVPSDWVVRQLAHAQRGAAAVAGVVELSDAAPRLRHSFHLDYDAGVTRGAHVHVHGANLGVRTDVLLACGNWPLLATGEDHGLWRQLGELGVDLVRDPGLVVCTSARTAGRAPSGFSVDLANLAVLDPT